MSAVQTFDYSQDTQIFNMGIGAGGQQAPYAYHYVINFNNAEWQIFNYTIQVRATQTYPVTLGAVDLVANATYAGQLISTDLQWNVTNANTLLEGDAGGFGSTGLQYGVSGQKLSVSLAYTVPNVVVSPAVANVTCTTQVTFQSLPGIIPSTRPTIGPVTIDNKGNSNVGGLGSLLSFLGSPTGIAVAAIGIIGLALFSRSPAGESTTTIITSGLNRAKRRIRRK